MSECGISKKANLEASELAGLILIHIGCYFLSKSSDVAHRRHKYSLVRKHKEALLCAYLFIKEKSEQTMGH